MKFRIPSHRSVAIAICCLSASALSPVWAQDEPPADPQAANPAADERRQLEEIIVTAQRRSESLQDVPVSVAVISGEEIEARGLESLEEVTKAMPNVYTTTSNLIYQFNIRGMGTSSEATVDPSVAIIIDDVPTVDKGLASSAFLDVDRIEVLRGPQGTLFGRNTVAGAIVIKTKNPHNEWEWKGLGQIGDFDARRYEGLVNIPVIEDILALRAAVTWEEYDGFVYNTFKDEDDGRFEKLNFSAKGLWNITDNLALRLSYRFIDIYAPDGYGYQNVKMSEDDVQFYQLADPDFESNVDHQSSKDYDEEFIYEKQMVDAVLSWTVNDYILSGIFAWSGGPVSFTYDADYSPYDLANLDVPLDQDNLTAEFRLVSPDSLWNGRFSFVAGAFASQDHSEIVAEFWLGPATSLVATYIGVENPFDSIEDETTALYLDIFYEQTVLNLAGYAQGTFKITDAWDITSGIRYTQVKSTMDQLDVHIGVGPVAANAVTNLFLPDAQGNQFRAGNLKDFSITDRNWDAKISTRYFFDDDKMIFGTVATGFKPGGYGNMLASDEEVHNYDEETSISYEIGVKTKWLDGLAKINATAFYSEYQDLQGQFFTGLNNVPDNTGEALTQGFELESQWVLPWNLILSVNGALLDAYYVEYKNAPCPASDNQEGNTEFDDQSTDEGCDLSGRPLTYAPDVAGSILLGGEWQLGSWPVMLLASADAIYQDDVLFQPDTDPNSGQEAYWLYNARIGLRDIDHRWQLTLFADNISDEAYLIYGNDATLENTYWGSVAPPRWWSISLTLNF